MSRFSQTGMTGEPHNVPEYRRRFMGPEEPEVLTKRQRQQAKKQQLNHLKWLSGSWKAYREDLKRRYNV